MSRLRRQTVWLLTMLSLMIVLSVYYIFSPKGSEVAYVDENNQPAEAETSTEGIAEDDADGATIENMEQVGHDELFTTIRLELQNERSMKKELLKDVVASTAATTEEKNEALDDITLIDRVTSKESIVQDQILATVDRYEDVLVRYDQGESEENEKVHVHVKVEDLSSEEAVNIMQMVKDEFGEIKVDVNYQSTGS